MALVLILIQTNLLQKDICGGKCDDVLGNIEELLLFSY